jgi:succinate-semialdehyde dehydrogenase/glutarate-semialdehyde dehydrogenase
VILCEDADVQAAVKAVIVGRYRNAGQACLGCKRVFVHDSVHDSFVSQLVERVGRYEPGDGTVKPTTTDATEGTDGLQQREAETCVHGGVSMTTETP